MSPRGFRSSSVALLVGLASRAWAATYCVDLTGSSCDVIYTGSAGLASALVAAAATATDDTIKIGAGTYLGPFTYQPSGNAGKLSIVGSGSDQTILSVPVPGSFAAVLTLFRDVAGNAANVSRIAIIVASSTSAGIQTDALVEDARITSPPGNGGPLGVNLFGTGSGIRRCQIDMNNVTQAIGVETSPGVTLSPDPAPAFVEDSSILNGLVTVEAFAPLRITRCTVSGKGNSAIIARGTT